ncbi:hypothetical protein GCM10023237_06540 [Streptomyces coeruleoprunus]
MLSVLVSLASAVAYAAGAITQERVAASGTAPAYAPLRHPAWWLAVFLTGAGALLHVVALAYGPLSVVQPLGALTIVFALPMAALLVGRRAGAGAWRGAFLATAGLAGLLALTGPAGGRSLGDGTGPLLAGVSAGTVALLFLMARGARRRVGRGVLLAAAAGVAFGAASVFTKAVAVAWVPWAPLAEWPGVLAVGVLAVAGLLLSQASYRGAGLAAPLATVTVVNPAVAAAVGVGLFGEQFRFRAPGTVLALGCAAVAAAGLVRLTSVSAGSGAGPGPGVSEGDAARPQVGEGVDVGAVARTGADLEVQVRS